MNRIIVLLLGLFMRVTMGQAQSALAVNARTNGTESVTTAVAPHQPKVTEAPFYVKVYGFYGLLTPGVQINSNSAILQSGASQPFKTVNKGLGAGLRTGLGIGLIVNDFINVGIDAEALFGTPIKTDFSFEDGIGKSTTTSVTTLNVVSLIPNVTFKALSRPTYYIYNRLGLVGGMVVDYKTVISYLDQPKSGVNKTTSGTTSRYTKNSLALGYQASLGIQFRLSQAIRGFVEIVAYNQSFKPQRLEVSTPATATKPATVLVTEYNDQGSVVDAKATITGKDSRFNVPMNSVGVGAGLVFRF